MSDATGVLYLKRYGLRDDALLRRLADVGRRQIFAITDVTQKEQSSGGRFSRETNRNLLLIISDIL
jgi:hypothetical protein